MDDPLWCEDRCRFWGNDAAESTDWEAYDCYRECLGLPPAPRPWWMRAGREAGRRIAAAVYDRGGHEAEARIAAYLTLALAVVLGLIALGVALNLIAGT